MIEFLNLKPKTFGLDISDFSLRIAELSKRGRFLSLTSWGQSEIKPGLVQNGEIKDEEQVASVIKESLKHVQGGKIKARNVVASLPEDKSFLQVIQMPKMAEEDLRSAIQFEAENYIPLPLDEVYLDFQVIPPLFNHLDHFDVLLVASPKNIVDSYSSCLKKAGLAPYILEAESQSIARSLVKKGISPAPVLLVDFGKSASTLVVYSGRSVRFTSTIPVSSQQLTEAIARNLEVDLIEAEKLKTAQISKRSKSKKEKALGEKSLKNRKVFEAMAPIISDLIGEIRKHINYYQTHRGHEHLSSSNKKVEKIILCGRGANLEGLSDSLSFNLNIPVELGNPWINILPEPLKELPGLSFKDSLGYSATLGLALGGLLPNSNL